MDPLVLVDAVLVGVANLALVSFLSRLSRRNAWLPIILAGATLRLALDATAPGGVPGRDWNAEENEYYHQKGCRMTFS